jgi:glycosyltransferase involved in cell wall biosynthesis
MSSHKRRRIAVTPVFNESGVITSVLDRISEHVDIIIISEDCSTDGTKDLIMTWMEDHPGTYLIAAHRNQGASAALKKGYILVTKLLEAGLVSEHDLVVEIDSDGQHDPSDIPRLMSHWESLRDIDVVLARRDFSNYPFHKIVGNRGLTLIATVLSRFRYHDVESNYRVMPVAVFKDLLGYFQGYRYSGAFEVGIILPLLGYRTDNELEIRIPYYRAGSRVQDGFHIVYTGMVSWFDVIRRKKRQDYQRWVDQVAAEVVNEIPGLSVERGKEMPRQGP